MTSTDSHRRLARSVLASFGAIAILLFASSPANAGTADNPEIADGQGDVTLTAFALDMPDNAAFFSDPEAYDLTKAYVAQETEDAFFLRVHVKDFPQAWDLPPAVSAQAPYGPEASYASMNLTAHWGLGAAKWSAVAELNKPTPATGSSPALPVLLSQFRLVDAAGAKTTISGAIDLDGDYVQFRIPKSAVGYPADGSQLTQFWTVADFAGKFKVDFAPDASTWDPLHQDQPPVNPGNLAGSYVVVNQFGRDYAFGQWHPAVARVEARAVSGLSLEVEPNQAYSYEFTVKNSGNQRNSGLLTLSPAAAGWSRMLDDTTFDLAAGASKTFRLRVMALEGAAKRDDATVFVDGDEGGSSSLTFTSSLKGFVPNTESVAPINPPEGEKQQGGGGGKSPGFGAAALVATLAALVALLRRRTR